MKKTESNQRLITALEKAIAGTAYEIQIRDYETEIALYIRNRGTRDRFTPEIFFEDAPYGDESASAFTVQTAGYGAMKPEDIDAVIEGLRSAADLAKALNVLIRETATEETHMPCPDGEHEWECESAIGPDSGTEYFTCTKCGAAEKIVYY